MKEQNGKALGLLGGATEEPLGVRSGGTLKKVLLRWVALAFCVSPLVWHLPFRPFCSQFFITEVCAFRARLGTKCSPGTS